MIAIEADKDSGGAPARREGKVTDAVVPVAPLARRRWSEGRRLLIAAAAAAALITLGTLFGVSRDSDRSFVPDPDPPTGREVIESSLAVSGAASSIQGVMIGGAIRGGEFDERQRIAFSINDDGDVALAFIAGSPGGPWPSRSPLVSTPLLAPWPTNPLDPSQGGADPAEWRFVCAADGRYERSLEVVSPVLAGSGVSEPDGEGPALPAVAGTERVALGAGEPFRGDVDALFPLPRIRAYMRLLLAGESPDMREITLDGHAAWELTTVPGANPALAGASRESRPQPVTIVIDKQTWLPIELAWNVGENRRLALRFTDLRVDEALPRDAFALDFPDTAFVDRPPMRGPRSSRQFAEIDLNAGSRLRETLGAVPGSPGWRPQGFALAEATWSAACGGAGPTVGPGSVALSFSYRRGLDAFYVSVWPSSPVAPAVAAGRGDAGTLANDPLLGEYSAGAGFLDRRAELERLRGGAFDGQTAYLVLDSSQPPYLLPHLWVRSDKYTATVSGDLTQDEMIQVAESLGAPWMEE